MGQMDRAVEQNKSKAKLVSKAKPVNNTKYASSKCKAQTTKYVELRPARIHITKVVTRNFVVDWWSGIQNLFGSNLKQYEDMIQKAYDQIDDELRENEIDLIWYRYELTQLTNGAIVVSLYGEAR